MTDDIVQPGVADEVEVGGVVAAAPAVETEAAEVVAAPAPEATEEMSMEAAMAGVGSDQYSMSFPRLSEGDVVKGTVVHIDREGVMVDVGAKSEGIIRPGEISRDPNVTAEDVLKVGDVIPVYVMEARHDGRVVLSRKRAEFEQAWVQVVEARDSGKVITAMVTDRVKGGLVVDLGIRGFVPASHVGSGSLKTNLDKYIGQTIHLKVIEVDKDKRKVVLSNKLANEEERQSRRAETVGSLQVGQTRNGVVRRLTNYGAFVDLGGIDGLLHISEMSWTRINHPQEVLKEGDEVDVVVLKMDLDQGRVSLGMRQILPDPWTEISKRYRPGDLITGVVTRVVPFGAFVQVEGGIEGIIPNAESGSRRGARASDVLHQGSEVEVKVLDVRPEERKMTLSLRQARVEEDVRRERKVAEEFQVPNDRDEPRFTIGDAFRAKHDGDDPDFESY
ncbi:MAG: 30S ribosomal protein S1 [Armatimonadetes bacterium]|nr:30S ribosomal protein S1 [Armatimonadota bacterium]